MANIVVESLLKTLVDADTWTVEVEGVTKDTYIWAESHSRSFNLDHIHQLTVNSVVIVIHPSVRQLLQQTQGSKVYSFQGDLVVHAKSVANLKSALTALKGIVDAEPHLIMLMGGVAGSPMNSYYTSRGVYLWAKHSVDD